jgi:secreted trypsin-like serine protease
MSKIRVLVVSAPVLLGAMLAPLAPSLAGDTEMIVGGTPVPEGKYPWQVRIFSSMDDQKGLCGGSLISDQWVLTAAHCAVEDASLTENLKPVDSLVVGYGSIDRTQTTKVESEKIVVNPLFLAHGLESGGDLALIKLQTPIQGGAKPIDLADPTLDKKLLTRGAKVTVTGWGAIWDPDDKEVMDLLSKLTPQTELGDKVNFPLKLHEVDIQVMDPDECRAMYQASHLNIHDSEICAMKPGAASNSCYGDSGGPLIVYATDPKRYVQVGVVSWGDRCARLGNPNVFARVSSFNDWINETIGPNVSTTSAPQP